MPSVADVPKTVVSIGQWMAPKPAFHWTVPHVTSWTESSVPPALPGLIYAKLGDAAWQRFFDFSRWPDGWAGAHSHAIAWGTYCNFERFLDSVRFVTSRPPPSLFLTDEGYLELAWEARDGSTINVAFRPEGADYYFESSGDEGAAGPHEIAGLAARCNSVTL